MNLIFMRAFLGALLVVCTHAFAEQEYTVSQAGTVFQILGPDVKEILLADPAIANVAHFQFEIELPKAEVKEPDEVSVEDLQEDERAKSKISEVPADADISELLARANLLYNQKRYGEAHQVVDRAIALNPSSAKAWAMRGSLKKVRGDLAGARQDWQKALSLEPAQSPLATQLQFQLSRPE